MMGGESYPLAVSSGDRHDDEARRAAARGSAGGPAASGGYALLDAGDGRRLERFGAHLVDRPAPGALASRRTTGQWRGADLRFEPGLGWSRQAGRTASWEVRLGELTMELRTTSSGGVGLYPEHAANLGWLEERVRVALGRGGRPSVLNLFAHTGLATLAAARAGASVAHVDAARASVAWARRNALRNELSGAAIRWLVDDAQSFAEREARRGHRYDGLIVDPPSAGHGRSGRWTLRDDLPRLLAACAMVATRDAFVLLTGHSTGLSGEALRDMLGHAFPGRHGQAVIAPLSLRAESGASLDLGWAVRLDGAPAPNAAP
jgi:23S rRNA (cytosine1962-C5)-methyltransferase